MKDDKLWQNKNRTPFGNKYNLRGKKIKVKENQKKNGKSKRKEKKLTERVKLYNKQINARGEN